MPGSRRRPLYRSKLFWLGVIVALYVLVQIPGELVHMEFDGAVGLTPEQAVGRFGPPLLAVPRGEGLRAGAWSTFGPEEQKALLSSNDLSLMWSRYEWLGWLSQDVALNFQEGRVKQVAHRSR